MGHILSEAVPEKCSRFGSEICVSVIFLYSYWFELNGDFSSWCQRWNVTKLGFYSIKQNLLWDDDWNEFFYFIFTFWLFIILTFVSRNGQLF